jgi:hypothetical protein
MSKFDQTAFYNLLNSVPNATLRDRVADSALTNASDTMLERGRTDTHYTSEFWEMAITTARMVLDCPQDYYPELFAAKRL